MNRLIRRVKPGGEPQGQVQYPGQQKGQSRTEVKNYIADQVRRKGFPFSGGATTETFPISLSGTAKYLWGLAFLNSFSATCTLTINNEVVFENVHVGFLLFGQTEQDYFAVNRPLSGNDDIKLAITATAGYTLQQSVFYYK